MVKNRKHNVNGKKNREEQSEWIKPGKHNSNGKNQGSTI
jgi:hypothetical protein